MQHLFNLRLLVKSLSIAMMLVLQVLLIDFLNKSVSWEAILALNVV